MPADALVRAVNRAIRRLASSIAGKLQGNVTPALKENWQSLGCQFFAFLAF
ncbi:MAG: hypothetical protein HYR93_03160 [Chloroflexi bacterium]|nr:hypothetical protein [Chloroflexota bacterium]MBI2757122.1 hypothetical protein [Chloroflexota bacterium]